MPNPPLSKAIAEETVKRVEDKLREGYRPQGLSGPGEGAIRAAARDAVAERWVGSVNTFISRMEPAKSLHGLEPDWSVYRPPLERRRAAVAPKALDGFEPSAVTEQYDGEGKVKGQSIRWRPDPVMQPGGIDAGDARDGAGAYVIKSVSTYYDAAGEQRQQWVKTSLTDIQRGEMLREFMETLAAEHRGKSPLVERTSPSAADVLVSYKFGDPHFGMSSSSLTGADDFDTDDAERLTRAGIDQLLAVTPNADTCILEVIGDVMHANDSSALTPGHKNPLDVDKRGFHYALMRAGLAWAYAVERALEKHETVIVWMLPGNHDPDAVFGITMGLAFYFQNNPRVVIPIDNHPFRYHQFGKNLFGAHHGDKVKMGDLPLLMAVDQPEAWGQTVYRYITTGHIHHDVVKELQGVRVESLRTLAAKDTYHAMKGYRSLRDTRAAAYHREYGEFQRHTVSAAMLEAA